MPIFHKDNMRVLYVHVPKTGGSYIEQLFENNGFMVELVDWGNQPGNLNTVRRCSPQHMHYELLDNLYVLSAFDYIFVTVRDPLERVISEYRMRKRGNWSESDMAVWFDKIIKKYLTNPYILDNHMRPQSEFYIPSCTIFKLEDGYDEDFVSRIEGSLGVEFTVRKIEKVRVRDRMFGPNSAIDKSKIDAGFIESVCRFYHDDYSFYGY